jgi:predicted ATPase
MPIGPFLIGGYRSFGAQAQRFPRFSKLNLFIGENNCGKSNVLRFLHEVAPNLSPPNRKALKLSPLDTHIPGHAEFRYGFCVSLRMNPQQTAYDDFIEYAKEKFSDPLVSEAGHVLRVLKRKAELDGTQDAWFEFNRVGDLIEGNWREAFSVLNDQEIYAVWHGFTGASAGSRGQHWFPESLRRITPSWPGVGSVLLIPAIRRIAATEGPSEDFFGGSGLVAQLAKLQNPSALAQAERRKFERINEFLRSVTENGSATIEIPHDRETIIVHIDGKSLPLESLGTGIHEVIILAAASTIPENSVICMEEPEIHLNPILQKKLVRYLAESTTNQYFVTTHSAALMDAPGAEIYHMRLVGGETLAERVTSDRHRSSVCESLGYHPSDLMQANCLIWVEGPSDRIYLKHWLGCVADDLIDGVHFSIMFYGGKLAAHVSGEDIGDLVDDFVSLRRLNRRSVILIDSDFRSGSSALNATKQRLVEEFNKGPGFAWVTAGREIENYLPPEGIKAAIASIHPAATPRARFGRYDNVLEISGKKKSQASKVLVSRFIAGKGLFDISRLDLEFQLSRLVCFIRESNPRLAKPR